MGTSCARFPLPASPGGPHLSRQGPPVGTSWGGACSARPSLGIPGFNRRTSAARVELWAVQGSGVVDELGSSARPGHHVSPFAPWEPSRSPASSSALPCPRAPWVQPARQKKGVHVFLPSAPGPWAPSPQLLPGCPLSGSPSPWTFLPSPRGPCGGFSELLSLSPNSAHTSVNVLLFTYLHLTLLV